MEKKIPLTETGVTYADIERELRSKSFPSKWLGDIYNDEEDFFHKLTDVAVKWFFLPNTDPAYKWYSLRRKGDMGISFGIEYKKFLEYLKNPEMMLDKGEIKDEEPKQDYIR